MTAIYVDGDRLMVQWPAGLSDEQRDQILADATRFVAAEVEAALVRCPGCSHRLHAFDVCSCGCDDQVGSKAVSR